MDCIVYDIETNLCTKFDNAESVQRVITSNSRYAIQKNWRDVISEIKNAIRLGEDKLHIIIGHSVYYNYTTKEFFSVFDTSHLNNELKEINMKIHRTVLLIDDVYDIFHDLSKTNELFGSVAFEGFMQRYATTFNITPEAASTDSKALISWIYFCINYILSWRSQEILLSQTLSQQLKSDFLLWAIKQDDNSLFHWLSDDSKIFYLPLILVVNR